MCNCFKLIIHDRAVYGYYMALYKYISDFFIYNVNILILHIV